MTVAVGFFDGVHRGHRAILMGADVALTFINHPMSVICPEKAPQLLMSFDERYRALKACGVGKVVALDFTTELAELSPTEFIERHFARLVSDDGEPVVRCGANWRFGKNAAGTTETLSGMGFKVEVAPYVEYKGEPISSSRIRAALLKGELEDAQMMLGHNLTFGGMPVRGKGMGSTLGYPTLNLPIEASLPHGVYSAIVNYGTAPTMGKQSWVRPMMEVHLHRFLREERKFDTIDELKAQITRDVEMAFTKG